jgi:putative membrane protein
MALILNRFVLIQLHHLGEDGIYYKDLYYLVKFLPGYALPAGIPSDADLVNQDPYKNVWSPMSLPQDTTTALPTSDAQRIFFNGNSLLYNRTPGASMSAPHLPLPATTSTPGKMSIPEPPSSPGFSLSIFGEKGKRILPKSDEKFLLPPRMPPKYHIFDLFPFSLLVKMLTKKGKEVKGRKAARMRAKMRHSVVSHNLPLEISLYLASLPIYMISLDFADVFTTQSSYIAALQQRKSTDVPTISTSCHAIV